MRKLIVQQWATVDNIVAEEDGGLSFVAGEPFNEKSDPAFKASVMGFMDTIDTMIMGANTYNMAKDYWPYAEEQGEFGEKVNTLAKYVASSKLEQAPWGEYSAADITRDPIATIRELKARDGKDIWLWGSLTLVRAALDAGVVDEVQMRVCPVSRGKGTHFFHGSYDLTPLEATAFGNGVVLLRYAVDN